MKRIIVLGSTGSIGKSTLDIVRSRRDLFQITGLSAHSNSSELLEQADEFGVKSLALSGIIGKPSERVHFVGEDGLLSMIRDTPADIVVNGIAGSYGLKPSVAAIESGKHLALANKETIVMAGKIVRDLAVKFNVDILPVDSEHSAVFQLLRNSGTEKPEEIILTASGGAFRDIPLEALSNVRLEDALIHPTWSMGPKITIDSATMANKGLEVIEAGGLFDIDIRNIKVVIHPQSCIHALVRMRDGSMYAQISKPDMRIPIQNALSYPDLIPCPFGRLELEGATFEFRKPDFRRYPLLPLAYHAACSGGGYPAVFNASNEMAVTAFMERKILYVEIPDIVNETMSRTWPNTVDSIEHVFYLDGATREIAGRIIDRIASR